MARRLAFGWAGLALCCCANAFAIGLGEITVHSALNQNFDADIELLQARGMQESEILAQLGTTDDFKRVGVERFYFLTGLHFKVEMNAQGGPMLHITSDTPITEPYLNFLVQVMWPNGRMLKEYTVLLDPPTYKDQPAPAVASPSRSDRGGGGAGRVERTPTRPDSQVSLRSAPPSTQQNTSPLQPAADRLNGDSYGVTDRDDTLWAIAQRTRPSADASVQQTMLAIVRLNPQAFIGGNINLLKAGYTLRLPSQNDVAALTQPDAIAQVAEQNAAWQAYRRGEGLAQVAETGTPQGTAADGAALAPQIDATAATKAAATAPGADGELHIVAADGADQGTGTGGGAADVASLEGELAATQEETERLARERDEAVQRLDDVTAKAEQSQRQIEVRDQQIAQLQAQLKALQSSPQTAAPATTAATSKPSGLGALLASPFVLIGAAVVLVLIVVAGLMRARGRKAASDDHLVHYDVPRRAAAPTVSALADDEDEYRAEPDLSSEDEVVVPGEEESHAGAPETAQTSDVIGEADIYIAYGRYPQAINLLQGALDDDPDRHDVRLKLLEVYAETKEEAAFGTQMEELLARCDDNELLLEARELESKLREDGGVVATTTSTSQAPEPVVDDFELDLDTDDDVAETTARMSHDADDRTEGRGGSDDLGGDLGIDFRGDDEVTTLRSTSRSQAHPQEEDEVDVATAADDDDEFNLEDLEYDPPAASTSRAAPDPKKAEADDAFDFLDEEDAATTKLDLARAYIDMGDADGAREILSEVLQEGSNEQQQAANELLAKLS